jgi:autotransporter-associated beta strand protein
MDFVHGSAATTTVPGVISGTGSLTNDGGTLILSGANTMTGGVVVNSGTVKLGNASGLGAPTSIPAVNGGVLDINGNNITIGGLIGTGGIIQNGTGAATNTITINGTTLNAYNGVVQDNPGTGGKISVVIEGGATQRFNGNGTFTGTVFVGTNSAVQVGANASAGTGLIVMSNNATAFNANAGGTASFINNNFLTVDGATAIFTSGSTGNGYTGTFSGSALATNQFNGTVSLSATSGFSNFLGTALFVIGGTRWNVGGNIGGGDNTIFDLETNGNMFNRDQGQIHLGALVCNDGTGSITGSSVTSPGTYTVGAKNLNTIYSGTFTGSNYFIKVGTGGLTFNAAVRTTNTDSSTFTNYLYTNGITHTGNTTVSNGTLKITCPNLLTNSPSIVMAGTSAILDVSTMGYVSPQTDGSGTVTNTLLVTNSTIEIIANENLNGYGTITGNVLADLSSTLNPGNVGGVITNTALTNGVLNISGSASIFGAVRERINRTNAVNADEIAAASFAIDPGATLYITNIGPALQAGDVFHMFNHPVSFTPANITLPTATAPLVLSNKLSIDGTLVVLSTVNTTPITMTNTYDGTNLNLSWPTDHIGWRLQAQTNTTAVGLVNASNAWTTVAGSTTTNAVSIMVNPANGAVFFRLVYP